jgi:predicted Zn finger-like uncharacterized protein
MPARLSCPECGAVPNVDDDLPPGKKIKCRKCGTVYPVPAGDAEPEGAVSPRRRPAPVAADDYDDDDDRESRRPRRRRRRQESNSGVLIGVLVAVILVGCLAIGAVALWAALKKETSVAEAPPAGQTPPPPPVSGGRGGLPPGIPPGGGQPPGGGGQPPGGNQGGAGPQVNQPAPEIDGEDIDGKKFKLSDYRGKVILLDFWGHW